MGTVGYMSPEQASGQNADYRSDQFSFGAIGYEMATGKKAFGRKTSAETLTAIIREDPEAISSLNPAVPAPVRWIIERCLAKDPDERFASTTDLARDLKSIRGHLSEASVATGSGSVAIAPRRRVPALAFAAVIGALAVLSGGLFWQGKFRKPPTPIYRRMTFQKGFILSGRFVPGGETAVYSAAWDGNPMRLFSVRSESPESSALAQPDAGILAISASGEMAIALGSHIVDGFIPEGTLARVPFSGGAPREVLEKVQGADWTPDGTQLAVVREEGGQDRLEFPIGKPLFQTPGWIGNIRFSPKGDRIAFIEHPARFDDGGSVDVVDLAGHVRKLSEGWSTVQGLAWSADGGEAWFTAAKEGVARSIFAVTVRRSERLVARAPGTMTLLDIARDGRILMSEDRYRNALVVHAPGHADRDLSLLDYSTLRDVSRDGTLVLFDESGQGGGPNYSIYIRKADGSPAVRLGDGAASAFSPDSSWVIATTTHFPRQLVLLPTRTGQPQSLPVDPLDHSRASFFPDGKKIAFTGIEGEKPARLFVQDLSGGKPRPVSPEGVGQARALVSPDGKLLVAQAPDRSLRFYPADGSASRPIAGSSPGDWPANWSADGRFLYVNRRGELPLRVFRIELATGRRELWKEISPADPSGFQDIGGFFSSADTSVYAYGYFLQSSDLYQLEGLK
jgi:Tol biopolymer transport system component